MLKLHLAASACSPGRSVKDGLPLTDDIAGAKAAATAHVTCKRQTYQDASLPDSDVLHNARSDDLLHSLQTWFGVDTILTVTPMTPVRCALCSSSFTAMHGSFSATGQEHIVALTIDACAAYTSARSAQQDCWQV